MAYNPGFYMPQGYQPQWQQPQWSQPQQQPMNGLVWIEGIEGANMYPMPPNSVSPTLMFKNEAKFAVKSTDGAGVGTVRVFSFAEDQQPAAPEPGAFVTKADLESFKSDVMEAINGKPAVQPDPQPGQWQPADQHPGAAQVDGAVWGGVQPDVPEQPAV